MASSSAQPATSTPTTLVPLPSSQGTSGNVQGPKQTTYNFLRHIQPLVAPLVVVAAPQGAAPPIVVPSHMSPASVPSPKPSQEEPQGVDPPVVIPSHISPASAPSPPPPNEAFQSAAPMQVPQEPNPPESEEDVIEVMVSAKSHPTLEDIPKPEEPEESSLPPTKTRMLIRRQIDHLYGLQNEMQVMYDIIEEIREVSEELAAEEQ
ncbi:hypothetical protein EI94DRAFT_1703848 [Lactarius quietus]|nr:hypothetical protein EI94DRAFT_1703848 [Lactarius quietus]